LLFGYLLKPAHTCVVELKKLHYTLLLADRTMSKRMTRLSSTSSHSKSRSPVKNKNKTKYKHKNNLNKNNNNIVSSRAMSPGTNFYIYKMIS
jgi:hypothetical protein